MPRDAVERILGKPDKVDTSNPNYLFVTYAGKKTGSKLMIIYDQEQVDQVNFTSKAYKTADGIGVGTYDGKPFDARFTKWKMKLRFVQTKYTLASGGLSFYGLNVDSANPEYPAEVWGVLHKGTTPDNEMISQEGQPDNGWTIWDGKDIYSGE